MTKFSRETLKQFTAIERLTLLFALNLFLPIYIMPFFPIAFTVIILKDSRLRNHLFLSPMMKPLLILFPLLLIVPIAYQNWYGAAASLAIIIVLFLSVFFCMRIFHRLYEAMLDVFCLGSVIAFIVAVAQRLYFDNPEYRVSSVFANPNYYGAIIVMVALICVYKVAAEKRPRRFYVLIGVMNLVGLYLCECRSAALPVFVGSFFIFLMNKRYKLFFLALGFFLVFLLILYKFPQLLPRASILPADGALRMDIWKTWWECFKLSPLLGTGPFTYIHLHTRFTDHFDWHSHNMFFEIVLCYGVLGSAALFSYFLKIIYMAVKSKNVWGRDALSLMLAVIIAVSIHGLTDYTIFWPQTALMFLMIIGGRRTVSDRRGKV